MKKFCIAVVFVFFLLIFSCVSWSSDWLSSVQYMVKKQHVKEETAYKIAAAIYTFYPRYIDPDLVLAVIQTESSFQVRIIGNDGERGLMQISDVALREVVRLNRTNSDIKYTPEKLFNVNYNILVGCRYLDISYKRVKRILSSYYSEPGYLVNAVMYYKDGFKWDLNTFRYGKEVMRAYRKIKEFKQN